MTGAGVVLPHEDEAAIDARFAEFEADLRPVGAVARFLVRRAAMPSIRMDRAVFHETATLTERAEEGGDATDGTKATSGRDYLDPSSVATLARRYEAASERGFHRCLKEIRLLHAERLPATRLAPAPVKPMPTESGSFRTAPVRVDPTPPPTPEVPTGPRPEVKPTPNPAPRWADQISIGRPPRT